jgi:hypothetical protein
MNQVSYHHHHQTTIRSPSRGNLIDHASSISRSGSSNAHNIHFRASSRPSPHTTSPVNQLGFQLDENEMLNKGVYVVRYVEPGSPSSMAGLKEGDRVTKINGKLTQGMDYEEFCREIEIAQQKQLQNNMIHLMVLRKSSKSTGTSSYSAVTTSQTSVNNNNNINGTVLPINNAYSNIIKSSTTSSNQNNKNSNNTHSGSNLADEGYVPGTSSASSSQTNNNINSSSSTSSSSTNNLVSIVKVTSPNGKTRKNEKKHAH